jgi:hypothetical protein
MMLAAPLAAARYRASGLVRWPAADIKQLILPHCDEVKRMSDLASRCCGPKRSKPDGRRCMGCSIRGCLAASKLVIKVITKRLDKSKHRHSETRARPPRRGKSLRPWSLEGSLRPKLTRSFRKISPLGTVRAARVDCSRPHLASVLQEGRKNASIHASSGVIWRIPAQIRGPVGNSLGGG